MPLFDKKDKSRYATFTRRSVGMGAGMTAVFAVLAGRLYQLQIRDGDQYMVEAEDNRVSERLIAPPRGRIMDRFGVELANSRRNYRVLLVSEQATEGVAQALDTIGKVIVLSDQQKKKIIHDIAMNKKFVPVPVAENLTWDEFSRVNLHLPYLPGVQCDVGETRDYPFGKELVHILGYVASVSPQDIAHDDDPLMSLPGMRIGKRGIEKQFDKEIRGQAGASRVEVNAYGRIIRELGKDAGEPGEDVYLTIDREVQALADQKLGDESAALVVMDVNNGDVIALSSTPGFDPNWFNVGLSATANGTTLPPPITSRCSTRSPAASIRPAPPSRPRWRWPPSRPASPRRIIASPATAASRSATTPSIAGPGRPIIAAMARWMSKAASRIPATSSFTKPRAGSASTGSIRRRASWAWARSPASSCRANIPA